MIYPSSTISTESINNGFLYKVKNNNNQTVGYLFGTIHEISKEDQSLLNNKIFNKISKVQKLFLEINILDEKILVDHLKNHAKPLEKKVIKSLMELKSISSEQAIKEIAKLSTDELINKPTSLEAILALKAYELGIEVNSLETEESRDIAQNAILDQFTELDLKRKFFVAYYLKRCSEQLTKLNENILINSNIETSLENLLKGYEFLLQAILHADFTIEDNLSLEKVSDLQLLSRINQLIDQYEKLFDLFALKPNLIESLKILCTVRKNKDKLRLEKAKLAWKKGSESMMQAIKSDFTTVEDKADELTLKVSFLRDGVMVDKIHGELQKSTVKIRNFYAIGSLHLIGNYENVIKRLEKKGWKIISAYKEST